MKKGEVIKFPAFYDLVVHAAGGRSSVAKLLEATEDGLDSDDPQGHSLRCVRVACTQADLPFRKVMRFFANIGCNSDLEFFANCDPQENPYITGQWQRLLDDLSRGGKK